MSSDAWKPTSAKKGSRNSGTNKSINDRPCKNCGAVREHPQKTDKYPPAVYCRDCHKSLNISNKRLRMRPNEADKKELERLSQEARARSIVSRQDAAKERVAAIVAECATQEEIDAEYDKLTEQIKEGRPAAGGLFWRQLCGLVCLCNCAICLLRSCTRRRSSWCFVTCVAASPRDERHRGDSKVPSVGRRRRGFNGRRYRAGAILGRFVVWGAPA